MSKPTENELHWDKWDNHVLEIFGVDDIEVSDQIYEVWERYSIDNGLNPRNANSHSAQRYLDIAKRYPAQFKRCIQKWRLIR